MKNENSDQEIRVRIAPSPTGALHVGTAHTALFNYLFAKRYGGTFIVRIEDTDTARSTKEWEENILQGLQWLGIEWDEGPVLDGGEELGSFGPYRQSERTVIYKKYLEKLLEEGKAFYCWHSKEELEQEEKDVQSRNEAPKHICSFRDYKLQDINEEQKLQSIIRFKNTISHVGFHDLVQGEIDFDAVLLGDFSIARKLDSPLYNFAVVVDDYTTRISHVIRGADHISNTPRQILIQEALGFPRPLYAHLPLLLGKDRSKLSKRHAATSVSEYKDLGYLPEALFNFLALLGYAPEAGGEILTPQELTKEFSLERVQKSNAIFDTEKLDWINGMYIRKMSVEKLTQACLPFFAKENINADTLYIQKIVALEQDRMKRLTDIIQNTHFFFEEPRYEGGLLQWKQAPKDELQKNLDWVYNFIEGLSIEQFEDAKVLEEQLMRHLPAGDRGAILWPLRAALTGEKASPPPFEVMAILGKEKTLARLERAKELLAA